MRGAPRRNGTVVTPGDVLQYGLGAGGFFGGLRLVTPTLLKVADFMKGSNGNGRSYVEVKDTVLLGAKMEELVENTAQLKHLPRIVELMHAEIAEVRNDVNENRKTTTTGFAGVHASLDALAFGVQQMRSAPNARTG